MTAGIYKLTGPNGKCYIGQSVNLEKRLMSYSRCACSSQPKIYRAIKKYGWSSFKVEYLHVVNPSLDDKISILNKLEIEYIREYDSATNGYNLQLGGLNGLHSEETKFKMSQFSKGIPKTKESIRKRVEKVTGRKHTDEAKAKISISLLNQTQEMKDKRAKSGIGRVASEETLIKLSNSRKNHPRKMEIIEGMNAKARKPVLQFDLDGNFIKEWEGSTTIGRELNLKRWDIGLCCHNKKKDYNGFIWKFKAQQ